MMTKRKRLGTSLGFIGLAVAMLTWTLWFRQANMVAIPEDRTLFVIAFVIAAGLGVAAVVVGTRWFGGIAAVFAVLVGSFLPFTVAISPQRVAENPVRVRRTLPMHPVQIQPV